MILFSGHLRHAGCRRHQAYGLCRGAREEHFLSDGRERRRTPDGRGVPPGLPAGRRALENVGAKCCPVTKQQHEQQQKKWNYFDAPIIPPLFDDNEQCACLFSNKSNEQKVFVLFQLSRWNFKIIFTQQFFSFNCKRESNKT